MKVDMDSWHYRFIDNTIPSFHSSPLSKTSCGYILAVFLCFSWAVFLAAVAIFMIAFFGSVLLSLVYIPYLWIAYSGAVAIASPFYSFFVLGVMIIVIVATMFTVAGIAKLFKYILNRKAEKLEKEKEKTMMEAINDRRKGICTLVEYY